MVRLASDCIFCKIANKEIPTEILLENEYVIAFPDLHPVAPIHVLVIPKKHIPNLADIAKEDHPFLAAIPPAISELAKKLGAEKGFRVVMNCGADAGQTVNHLHYHILAGRAMKWPPG